MNIPVSQNQFFLALAVLLVIHTAVSLGAYRWLTKTTVQESPKNIPVEATMPEQAQRGERVYIANTRIVSRIVPWPVPCYIWAGYAGLGAAFLIWLVQRVRPIHP